MSHLGVQVPKILLPAPSFSREKWAVVACDQYTSQLSYWQEVASFVGEAPSTLHLIFPEVYLGQDDAARISNIQATMQRYVQQDLFVEHQRFIVLQRTTKGPHGPHTRSGLMIALDLEHYDFNKGAQSLTRASEGTILDRLPPRIRIREGAPLELPHVMILIDDPTRSVIEPLLVKKETFTNVYNVELMQEGGHLVGYTVDPSEEAKILAALEALASPEVFSQKYGLPLNTAPLLFAVGDGNHSLATAKSVWEKLKAAGAPGDHPGRFALVEIVNVHDAGLEFEPIHRVLFDIKKDFFAFVRSRVGSSVKITSLAQTEAFSRVGGGDTHRVAFITDKESGVLEFLAPTQNLPVATLQILLDQFMAEGGAHSIDYVHGTDAVCEIGQQPNNLGLYLSSMSKGDFFKTVLVDGALPRKTFSMGEAYEKRFYLECRRILPENKR
jgi:hypothetical protein